MSATTRRLIVLVLVLGVFCWIFGDAIFRDRNFVYRDAGHFYYPLLKLVRDEWQAGRWPLWNPYENGGMPLLGNPASAVLYPPRIVLFQWLPISYGTASKMYILLHVLLSAAAAYAMARHWKASEFGAGLAALCYAFGAVVMFQYCNVIFLVGASWVPLGLVAADRALSSGDCRWAIVLGIILALQMLGGDPEAAYVTGGLAALYVALLDLPLAAALCITFALTGVFNVGYVSAAIDYFRQGHLRLSVVQQREFITYLLPLVGLGSLATWLLWRPPSRGAESVEVKALRRRRRWCLAVAAVAAAGLSAVQWIPTWEFSRLTLRAAGGIHLEPYAFWVAPWRFAELLWPNVSGRQFPQSSRWLDVFHVGDRIWQSSLYCGAVPLVLALAACAVRRAEHWQRWLTIMLAISLWGAMGPAGGPSWYFTKKPNTANVNESGAADAANPAGAAAVKPQPRLRDELETPGGGLYWIMVQSLPGFGGFRYPAKLMIFVAVAVAALAAVGWDRLLGSSSPGRPVKLLRVACALSLVGTVVAIVARPWLNDFFRRSTSPQIALYYGPLQASEATRYIVLAFATTTVVLGVTLAAKWWLQRRTATDVIAALVLGLVALDITLANNCLIATTTQSAMDTTPRVVRILEQAEASDNADGTNISQPYRVHRVSIWSPLRWANQSVPDQNEEVFRWERDTIQPKYGVPYGICYTINEGTMELFDYWFFFGPFYRSSPPGLSKVLEQMGHPPAPKVVYYPRRGFDMWGAKYFVLPKMLLADQENRGFLAFLPNTEPIESAAADQDDFQVLRNTACYPRAWIVHQWIMRQPIHGMDRLDRQNIMEEILYQGDEFWFDPAREPMKRNPHHIAWVEMDLQEAARVQSFLSPHADPSLDRCKIVRYEPQQVEIEVETAARGLMVLADVLFPGWSATVDGQPQPILRTNRIMRGITLEPGKHRVVFEYDPPSFRVGAAISLVTCAIVGIVGMALALPRRLHGPKLASGSGQI